MPWFVHAVVAEGLPHAARLNRAGLNALLRPTPALQVAAEALRVCEQLVRVIRPDVGGPVDAAMQVRSHRAVAPAMQLAHECGPSGLLVMGSFKQPGRSLVLCAEHQPTWQQINLSVPASVHRQI